MSLGPGWWLRNTPTPQTPKGPSQSNNVNKNKYSILQQSGHIHLPGLVQKPQQHIIPGRFSNQRVSEPVSVFSNQRVSEPITAFSNQRVSKSNRKQWTKNRNVAFSLESENDSSHEQENNVIFASIQFSRPAFESGRYPQERRCFNLKKPESERPDGPRYTQDLKYSYLKNTYSEQPSLQYGDHMTDSPRYPQEPQYPSLQYLYQEQCSHPKSAKKTGFLPQIYSNTQIDSDETLNTSPRRKNWSSPICYYEDPTLFWVDVGIESGTLFLLLILYNYHPCWSVTRRFVSQRKVRLPGGDLTFRRKTKLVLQQG